MRNKILSLFNNTVPYVKELRTLCGSVTASILLQQLDYWFARYPNGFYKFLSKPDGKTASKYYKSGQSWTEELGFSDEEFRTAFAKIGVSFKSKTAFLQAVQENKQFSSEDGSIKYYARYFDRDLGTSFYFRNHSVIDTALDTLFQNITIEKSALDIEIQSISLNSGIPETDKPNLPDSEKVDLLETENVGLLETENVGLPYIAENKTQREHKSEKDYSFAEGESKALGKRQTKKDAPVVSGKSAELRKKLWEQAEKLGGGVIANSGKEARAEKQLRGWVENGKVQESDIFECIELMERDGLFAGKTSVDGYSPSLQSVVKYMPIYLRRKESDNLQSATRRFESTDQRRERIQSERDYKQITEDAFSIKQAISSHLKPRK